MINLRYHIVSITAVFLALGIGVMLGSTFLDRYTVDQLDRNISSVESRIAEVRAENEALQARYEVAVDRDRILREVGADQLFEDVAVEVPVVLVSVDGIDEASTSTAVRALTGSGADFRGVLTVTSNFNLDDETAAELSETLGLSSVAPATVRRDAVRLLASALTEAGQPDALDAEDEGETGEDGAQEQGPDGTVSPPGSTTTPPTEPDGSDPDGVDSSVETGEGTADEMAEPATPDVVMALMAHGLLTFRGPDGSADDPLLSGTGYRYVFLSGPSPAVPDELVLLPLLETMASEAQIPGVVASAADVDRPEATRDAVVGAIRDHGDLTHAVSTVDNLETFNGIVSVMLALEQVGQGIHGHYGEGSGVTAAVPVGP